MEISLDSFKSEKSPLLNPQNRPSSFRLLFRDINSSSKLLIFFGSCLLFTIIITTIVWGILILLSRPLSSPVYPEQIHLSLGKKPNEMLVTWVTLNPTDRPIARYGLYGEISMQSAEGLTTKFVINESDYREIFIHRVIMDQLEANRQYVYQVGSESGSWSDKFWFNSMIHGSDWSPRLAIYGDMGDQDARILDKVYEKSQEHFFDAILHVGDLAYDLDDDCGRKGDRFMNLIQPIAAHVPYMVCPGNHEMANNFSHYNNRFSMIDPHSGNIANLFYSFNMGPIHVVSISTEAYYSIKTNGFDRIAPQYNWLVKDLDEATRPENRAQRPWIITMGHRPMYCSGDKPHEDCLAVDCRLRKGFPSLGAPGIEDLFHQYDVDISFWGHEHLYERSWPLYDYKVHNGSSSSSSGISEHLYINPEATVHIISGAAGGPEGLNEFSASPGEWSAKRISKYGFVQLTGANKTHLHIEYISIDEHNQSAQVADDFWIMKDWPRKRK
ncbi:acid phosphatase type 7-like [Brevipalpus obovatus]|uniref:acid phosphatase type 7-like n=1 Tax=Brevipalpus obovatus TaxID=246614 RepID=UPI003D9F9846